MFALLGAGGVLFYAFLRYPESMPPLPVSGSESFDKKAWLVRDALHRHANIDIIAAGSSMTLNDLSSDVLMEILPDHRVLNIAGWAMRISDSAHWLQHVLKFFHPKTVIMLVSALDFYSQEVSLDMSDGELDEFVAAPKSMSVCVLWLRKFSFLNYARDWRIRQRMGRASYYSLQIDQGGAVPIEVFYPNVDPVRWALKPNATLLEEGQYLSLSRLAGELRQRGVDLIVVQAPMRAIAAKDGTLSALQPHWRRVELILRSNGERFISAEEQQPLDDSYFCDYLHLNVKGMMQLTRELTRILRIEPLAGLEK